MADRMPCCGQTYRQPDQPADRIPRTSPPHSGQMPGRAAVVELKSAVGRDDYPDEEAGRGEGEERNADNEHLGGQEADGDEEPENEVGGGESPRGEVQSGLSPGGKKRFIDGRGEPHAPKDPAGKAVAPGFRPASHGNPVVVSAASVDTRPPVQPRAGWEVALARRPSCSVMNRTPIYGKPAFPFSGTVHITSAQLSRLILAVGVPCLRGSLRHCRGVN